MLLANEHRRVVDSRGSGRNIRNFTSLTLCDCGSHLQSAVASRHLEWRQSIVYSGCMSLRYLTVIQVQLASPLVATGVLATGSTAALSLSSFVPIPQPPPHLPPTYRLLRQNWGIMHDRTQRSMRNISLCGGTGNVQSCGDVPTEIPSTSGTIQMLIILNVSLKSGV